jgi:hypothetical protein
MPTRAETIAIAWQPLTPGGVAAFARASFLRLLVVQWLFAVVAALSVVCFLRTAWFPVVHQAIQAMPEYGEIVRGKLYWKGESPVQLAVSPRISFGVDLNHDSAMGGEADLGLVFGAGSMRIRWLGGYEDLPYPAGATLSFNQPDLKAWWEAREWMFLALTLLTVVLGLLAVWHVLGMLYVPAAKMLALLAGRSLTWAGAWRLCMASLLPGALFMATAIVCHASGALDLIRFAVCLAAHLIVGWAYVFGAVFCLPERVRETSPREKQTPSNPFNVRPESESTARAGRSKSDRNPFRK